MSETAKATMRERNLPATLPVQRRYYKVRAGEAAADSSLVPITFSSENPVKRSAYGMYWWYEVLPHDDGSVVTDRLEQGIAVLVNHDINQRAGILENGRIESNKGQGDIRFNNIQTGKDARQEVMDGTLPWISVGYIPHEEQRVADIDPEDDEDENYLGTYEVKRWEPLEVSLVAIPADPTVGVGRDLSNLPQYPVRFVGGPAIPPAEPVVKEKRMAVEVDNTNVEAAKDAKERLLGISAMQRQFPEIMTREVTEKFIKEDSPLEAVYRHVLEKQREDVAKLQSGGSVHLSENEARSYDFMRVVRSLAGSQFGFKEEAGFEREVSREIAKKSGRDTAGVFVPTGIPIFRRDPNNARERALVAGTSSAGGATVATELISFIDALRPKVHLFDMGVQFMGGMSSNFSLPKLLTDSDFNWVGENPGADNADIDPTFAQVQFTPHGATASTSFSRQLLVQSSIDVEARVRNGILQRAAIGIEKAALSGAGGTQPTGLLSASGVNVVAIGANGGQPSKGTFVDLLTQIAVANADGGDPSYLVTPEIAGYLSKTAELANQIALPIWTYQNGQGYVNGHKAFKSNLLPKNLVKGTSGAVCHAGIGGNWSEFTIAEFGAMELMLDPYSKLKQQLVNIVANFLVDANVTHAQAFSAYLDAIPQ